MRVQVPASGIRDAVDEVFRDPAYNRVSLLDRLLAWFGDVLEAVLSRIAPGTAPGGVYWILVIVIALVALGVAIRLGAFVALDRRAVRRLAAGMGGAGGAGRDAWALAADHASRGDHTAAAHALYTALLGSIAAGGHLDLHESKTTGDYVRELARRRAAFLAGFRDFARTYDFVIYGLGACDRDRYDRLHFLARNIVKVNG